MSLPAYSLLFLTLAAIFAWLLYRAHVRGRASWVVAGALSITKVDQPAFYAIFMIGHVGWVAVMLYGAVKTAAEALGL